MSAMVAPPVAKAGEPKKPVRKRKARSMPKLLANAVGIWKSTKITTYVSHFPNQKRDDNSHNVPM